MTHQVTFKFAPEDKVFFMHKNKVQEGEVRHCQVNQSTEEFTITYRIQFPDSEKDNYPMTEKREEKYVFGTKEDLLASL